MSDWSFVVSRTFSRLHSHGSRVPPLLAADHDDFYLEGAVVVPSVGGVVLVYSQRGEPSTSLSFMFNGRMYQRTSKRFYTALGLARVAAAFARDIATAYPWELPGVRK